MTIGPAVSEQEVEQVCGLMRGYGAYLEKAAGISIPNYEAELVGLPGPYAAPDGVLFLASDAGKAAGCVAMRPLGKREERACELKRLWVDGGFRGLGLGWRLMEEAITWAGAAGYEAVYLDTVAAAMPEANALYARLGFERVDRYNDNPVEDVIFFRLQLPRTDEPRG